MQKVSNVNAYQKLARQKGKMTFKNKVDVSTLSAVLHSLKAFIND
jgi:hypothetical protein